MSELPSRLCVNAPAPIIGFRPDGRLTKSAARCQQAVGTRTGNQRTPHLFLNEENKRPSLRNFLRDQLHMICESHHHGESYVVLACEKWRKNRSVQNTRQRTRSQVFSVCKLKSELIYNNVCLAESQGLKSSFSALSTGNQRCGSQRLRTIVS